MIRDEVVEEVRDVRARIEAENGGTEEGLYRHYREYQERFRDRMVSLGPPPRLPDSPEPRVPADGSPSAPAR